MLVTAVGAAAADNAVGAFTVVALGAVADNAAIYTAVQAAVTVTIVFGSAVNT